MSQTHFLNKFESLVEMDVCVCEKWNIYEREVNVKNAKECVMLGNMLSFPLRKDALPRGEKKWFIRIHIELMLSCLLMDMNPPHKWWCLSISSCLIRLVCILTHNCASSSRFLWHLWYMKHINFITILWLIFQPPLYVLLYVCCIFLIISLKCRNDFSFFVAK